MLIMNTKCNLSESENKQVQQIAKNINLNLVILGDKTGQKFVFISVFMNAMMICAKNSLFIYILMKFPPNINE